MFRVFMELNEALDKIRSMEVRGAGRIARFAAETVKTSMETTEAKTEAELEAELKDILRQLHGTRPTAVSLRNALRFIYNNSFYRYKDKKLPLDDMILKVQEVCDDFINRSREATEKIGMMGADLIGNDYTIQTHCNSSNALSVIKTAFKQGKSLKVYATESRPWYQGHITVKELAEENIPVTLIVDSAVRYFMDQVDIVLVGADTITARGDLINKIGTAQVALAAKDAGVPFVVCAEVIKFSPESLYNPDEKIVIEERDVSEVVADHGAFTNVNIANPVFDITHAEHISKIITESEVIEPGDAGELIKKYYGKDNKLEFLL